MKNEDWINGILWLLGVATMFLLVTAVWSQLRQLEARAPEMAGPASPSTSPAGRASYAQRISTTAWALLALLDGAR